MLLGKLIHGRIQLYASAGRDAKAVIDHCDWQCPAVRGENVVRNCENSLFITGGSWNRQPGKLRGRMVHHVSPVFSQKPSETRLGWRVEFILESEWPHTEAAEAGGSHSALELRGSPSARLEAKFLQQEVLLRRKLAHSSEPLPATLFDSGPFFFSLFLGEAGALQAGVPARRRRHSGRSSSSEAARGGGVGRMPARLKSDEQFVRPGRSAAVSPLRNALEK